MKLTGIALLVAALSVRSLAGQAPVGCYQVAMDPWKPNLQLGGDSVYITPPATLQLLPLSPEDSLRHPTASATPEAHPASESPANPWRTPVWAVLKNGKELVVEWSNGNSGFVVTFRLGSDTLTGNAKTYWDFGRPQQKTKARMWLIQCPG